MHSFPNGQHATTFQRANITGFTHLKHSKCSQSLQPLLLVCGNVPFQGSYRQVCLKLKDFSRTPKQLSYCIQGLKTYEKLIYT